ncbi:hypothetical protein FACS1894116_06300 [Betaproteobacteria bacterium]|nr:hypothetical protein FACS1894116_06300 [Betaproteobacteria bacterium]
MTTAIGAQLATRNVADFDSLSVAVVNPWEHECTTFFVRKTCNRPIFNVAKAGARGRDFSAALQILKLTSAAELALQAGQGKAAVPA